MGEPIVIVVNAQTEEAAQKLKDFVAAQNSGLEQLAGAGAKSGEKIAGGAFKARMGLMELEHTARSTMDILLMGGSPRMLLAQLPQMLQSATLMGFGLSAIIPVITGVAAAAGAGYLVWKTYKENLHDVVEEADKLNVKITALAQSLKLIQAGRVGGVLTEGGMEKLMGIVTGNIPYNVSISLSQAKGRISDSEFNRLQSAYHQQILDTSNTMLEEPNVSVPATPEERQKMTMEYLANLGLAIGKTDEKTKQTTYDLSAMGDALIKAHELAQRLNEPLSGSPEKLANQRDALLAQYNQLEGLATAQTGQAPTTAQNMLAQTLAPIKAQIEKTYSDAIVAGQQKGNEEAAQKRLAAEQKLAAQYKTEWEKANQDLSAELDNEAAQSGKKRDELYVEEFARRGALATKFYLQGKISEKEYADTIQKAQTAALENEKKLTAEIARRWQVEQEIERGKIEATARGIEGNPLLTEEEKAQALIPLYTKLIALNQRRIEQQRELAGKTDDADAKQNAEKEINQLQSDNADYKNRLTDLTDLNTFSGEFSRVLTDMQNTWGSWSHQLALSFENTINGAIQTVSSNLTGMITGTEKPAQAFFKIWTGVLDEVIAQIIHMGVQWVLTEAGMTAATSANSSARSLIHIGETAIHGAQVALRVGMHVAGEVAMSAATVAESAVRIAATIAQCVPYIITAGLEAMAAMASIPYVGPILAIAALGAVMAAGYGALSEIGGFEDGGFTGGQRGQPAGIVHGEEFVFDASSVDRIGVANLEAIRSGQMAYRMPDFSAAGAGGAAGTHLNLAVIEARADAERWAKSNDGETWFLSMMNKHVGKYQKRG